MTRPSGRVRSKRNSWSACSRRRLSSASMSSVPNSPRSARIAEVVGIARTLGEKRVGQVEQFLEIAVPGQPQLGVEHRDAVAHVVEGDAQFGLTLADLVEQPRVLHRDDRLRREVFEQRDLLVGERPHLSASRLIVPRGPSLRSGHEESAGPAIVDRARRHVVTDWTMAPPCKSAIWTDSSPSIKCGAIGCCAGGIGRERQASVGDSAGTTAVGSASPSK